MARPLRSTAAIVAASLAVSASAAVAGAQSGGTDAAKRIEAAVDRTTQERSANVQMTIVIDSDRESARITAGGAIDFDGDRGILLMDFSDAPPYQGVAEIGTASSAVSCTRISPPSETPRTNCRRGSTGSDSTRGTSAVTLV